MNTSSSPIDIVHTIDDGLSFNDLEIVCALCATAVVVIQDPGLPWRGTFHGSAGDAEFATKLITTIDSTIEAEQLFQAGYRSVQYGRRIGTGRATGATIDISECHLWTIGDGLVPQTEFLIDTSAMLAILPVQQEGA